MEGKMKIAVPTMDKVNVNEHFGRTEYFYIIEIESGKVSYIDNKTNAQASQGAGIQAATSLANEKIDAILSPSVGPKAYDVLNEAGIKFYLIEDKNISIDAVLEKYKKGELKINNGFKK
jgi:predicted Fe-Mo cluster-binding NifX family protein